MDFLAKGRRQSRIEQPRYDMDMQPPPHHHQPPVHHQPPRRRHIDWATRTVRIELFIVTLGCALILAALSLFLGFNTTTSNSEYQYVDSSKYQAVFLNGGITSGAVVYSTYFGHIRAINDRYVVLENVYYLTNNEAGSSNSKAPQLTKLGCQQLHAPYDRMIVNRPQVAFWENIQNDGKVVQAINAYAKANPGGPKCSNTSSTPKTTPNVQPSTKTP